MSWTKEQVRKSIKIPIVLSLILIAIHVINIFTGMSLGVFGVYPREIEGIGGIFTSPFVHGSFEHLFSNLIPLFAMTMVILLFYPRVAVRSFIMIYILTGLSVWIFARSVFHIGASGVVYGLISFVFWSGIFRRSTKSIILALIMILMYSGYFLGIFPNQEGISWESHLLGGIVGIIVAFFLRSEVEQDEIHQPYAWELEEDEADPFLPVDAFEKTRKEKEQERYYDYWNNDDTWQK